MAWILLISAGLFETGFAVCLDASDGFSKAPEVVYRATVPSFTVVPMKMLFPDTAIASAVVRKGDNTLMSEGLSAWPEVV